MAAVHSDSEEEEAAVALFVMTELFESSSSFFLTVILKEEDIWHSSVCVFPECKYLEDSKQRTIVTYCLK